MLADMCIYDMRIHRYTFVYSQSNLCTKNETVSSKWFLNKSTLEYETERSILGPPFLSNEGNNQNHLTIRRTEKLMSHGMCF